MSSEYSVSVSDWQDERWIMTGRDLMRAKMEEKGTPQNKEAKRRARDCGHPLEDVIDEFAEEHIPMMLYAYRLEFEPGEDEIIEVCERTNCTVVQDSETDEYYLALTGDGMDLSQDIALAFNIAQKWLPTAMLENISTQYGLSKSGKDFEQVRAIIVEQSKMMGDRLLALAEKWKAIENPDKKKPAKKKK